MNVEPVAFTQSPVSSDLYNRIFITILLTLLAKHNFCFGISWVCRNTIRIALPSQLLLSSDLRDTQYSQDEVITHDK